MAHTFALGSREEALAAVKEFNAKGIPCILSFLPVRHDDAPSVKRDVDEYERLLDAIHREKLDCEVSLKLHQFGVYGSKSLAEKSVATIVQKAHDRNTFVWIDMELSETVDTTLAIFRKLCKRYKNKTVGICLQAYLKRTAEDMRTLLKKPTVMRLVKGFYKEHDFKTWAAVTDNYARLMEYILLHSSRPAIATHDRTLISNAKKFIKAHRIRNAEFQFFKGVCDKLALQLRQEGFRVRMYIPYGNAIRFFVRGWKTFDNFRQLQRLFGVKSVK